MPRLVALILTLFCTFSVVAPLPAAAQEMPQPLSDTISDLAGLLTPDEAARLTQTLRAARDETGVQIVAATIGTLPAGQRIADYAKALFKAWGVGDATRHDGILILMVRNDRAVRVALGAGYDPVWDGAAQRAIDTAMLPAFRDGRYAEGLQAGAEAVIDRVARPFAAGQPAPPAPGRDWRKILVPLGMIAAFAAIVLRGVMRGKGPGPQRCPSCGHRGLDRAAGPVMLTTCPACGWTQSNDRNREARDRNGPPGGNGGGFGGGRSSGGGATGRW